MHEQYVCETFTRVIGLLKSNRMSFVKHMIAWILNGTTFYPLTATTTTTTSLL